MGPVFIGPCLHPCMKDFGYGHQARPDTRLCGAFRMLITAQSRINDVRLLTARPFAPDRATLAPCSLPSRRGLATTELVVTTSRRPALTAAARGAFEILAGRDEETAPGQTKKLSQEGHDAHGPVINARSDRFHGNRSTRERFCPPYTSRPAARLNLSRGPITVSTAPCFEVKMESACSGFSTWEIVRRARWRAGAASRSS